MKNLQEIELVLVPKLKYVRNMQSRKGKSNIFCKVVKHEKDEKAIEVYTLNKEKKEIFLGYVKKNEIETIFTSEANELYLMARAGDIPWDEAKENENWGKVKERIKHPIFSDIELEKIVKNINSNMYRFRFDYDINTGYLFIPSFLNQ